MSGNLKAYVPGLQTGGGFAYFLKTQLGVRVPSTVMIAPMSERFVHAIERFTKTEGVDLVTFEKGQRKDDLAQEYRAAFPGEEGVGAGLRLVQFGGDSLVQAVGWDGR